MIESTCHSRFSIGTNNAITNSTPIAMIAMPATFSSVERFSVSVWPRPVAVMPSTMKIALKLSTKSPALTKTERICTLLVLRSSSGESPDTVAR